jgi:hypothetical protein
MWMPGVRAANCTTKSRLEAVFSSKLLVVSGGDRMAKTESGEKPDYNVKSDTAFKSLTSATKAGFIARRYGTAEAVP